MQGGSFRFFFFERASFVSPYRSLLRAFSQTLVREFAFVAIVHMVLEADSLSPQERHSLQSFLVRESGETLENLESRSSEKAQLLR